MSVIDRFIAKKLVLAQTEKQVPVDISQAPKFPSAPDKVLQFRAPNQVRQDVESKPIEEHTGVDPELEQQAEEVMQLASSLRAFEDQVETMKAGFKTSLENFKTQGQYNERLKLLEQKVQEVGNALEGVQGSVQTATSTLFRLTNYWLVLQKGSKENRVEPNAYELLKQVLMSELPREKLQHIYAKVQKLKEEGTQISYEMNRSMTGFPIRDDHRKSIKRAQEEVQLNAMMNNYIELAYSLMSDLLEITTPIEDFLNSAGNKTQVDFSPRQKAASYGWQ